MAGFLYFVPGARTPDQGEAAVREAAGHALDNDGRSEKRVGPGPCPGSGILLAPIPPSPGEPARTVYEAEAQEWHPIPGSPCWVGLEKARRPGPRDLIRKKVRAGHIVNLADGKWIVPLARILIGQPALPQVVTLNAEGGHELRVADSSAWLWERACAFWDEWKASDVPLDASPAPAPPPDPKKFRWIGRSPEGRLVINIYNAFDAAVEVLAVNYRLGPPEASALELITSEGAMDVLFALVDCPSEEELEKKAPAAASSTTPGGGG